LFLALNGVLALGLNSVSALCRQMPCDNLTPHERPPMRYSVLTAIGVWPVAAAERQPAPTSLTGYATPVWKAHTSRCCLR